MQEEFKIFVEQLREGRESKIHETLSPEFLDIHERELQFIKPIEIEGETYLANDCLIIHMQIQAQGLMPCAICNESVNFSIQLTDFYHSEPIADIKSGVFNFKEPLRVAILLEVPTIVECHNRDCPKRKEYDKYFKKSEDDQNDDHGEGYYPFADLDLNP